MTAMESYWQPVMQNYCSSKEILLLSLGISAADVSSLAYKRADRYYPFGAHMFFWTGDANTGIFSGGTNGYFADYAHAAELRGFPTPDIKYQVSANRYRAEKVFTSNQYGNDGNKKRLQCTWQIFYLQA